MFELVCGKVAAAMFGWLVVVSGILAMKGHVRSSMIVSVSDCCIQLLVNYCSKLTLFLRWNMTLQPFLRRG